jgi:hypothetical protein
MKQARISDSICQEKNAPCNTFLYNIFQWLMQFSNRTLLGEILKYAKICRVENIMRPYLEMSV